MKHEQVFKNYARLLRAEEAADKLSLKVSTIRRWILEKRLPTVKLGRAIRIPEDAINKIIADAYRDSLR